MDSSIYWRFRLQKNYLITPMNEDLVSSLIDYNPSKHNWICWKSITYYITQTRGETKHMFTQWLPYTHIHGLSYLLETLFHTNIFSQRLAYTNIHAFSYLLEPLFHTLWMIPILICQFLIRIISLMVLICKYHFTWNRDAKP